jgi:hypothetical protein
MRTYILFFTTLLVLSSCKKWLDVKPVSEVSKDDLFNTEEGFQESLNGVYSLCTETQVYGNELTFGLPDVLAQNYTIPPQDYMGYQQTALYNYTNAWLINRKDNIWRGLYHAIANCNLLLENLDKRKTVLTAENYSLIKGEALALRAFFHLDLLRLFAPSYASNPAAKAIPYVTDFSNKATPMSDVTGACTKIIEDLNQAKTLLKAVDPILAASYVVGYNTDEKTAEQASKILFLQNRRHRMNYYAVCATLARAYLYMDKKQEALANAKEVIDSKKFPWTEKSDFIQADPTKKDRILYKELIFAWYIPQRQTNLEERFGQGATSLYIEENAGRALYETGGVGGLDNRFKEWFQMIAASGNPTRMELRKYQHDAVTNKHYLMAPAVRLSEVYYIAAESAYDTDPVKASAYVDSVRFNRGIEDPLKVGSKEAFLQELVKEARKEFYGEGQIFYMYKRLNRAIVSSAGGNIPASDKVFVLPLPNDEIEFGNR